MTIVTKPLTSEKKPMDLVQPLVTIGVKNTNKDAEKGIPNERYHYVLRHEKPPSSAATLCLLILALFVMSVGLFGGIYIYREMTRARFQKLWCKVPYARNEAFAVGQPGDEFSEQLFANKENGGLKKIDNDGLSYFFGDESMKSDADMELQLAESFFRENFELDTQNEQMAKIEVPDFKNGRMGRFIHEFDSNKTAIVDSSSGRCFIMPLDRDKVLPPRTMFDMIQKMANGYYTVNTKKIRETMRVVQPPITDFSDVGEYIKQECMEKNTYRLERSTRRIVKRNAAAAAGKKEKPYAETVGYYTIEYDILNLDELP